MPTSLSDRESGISFVGKVPWGTHVCQFYQSKQDLIDILVPYFKAGLENNEFCMWVTSEPLKSGEAKAELEKVVNDLDERMAKGQIEILDYSQWYTKTGKFNADSVLEGWVEKENAAIAKGFDGLRLTGNTFWLEKKDWDDFANYENVVNNVIGSHKMIAICTYSLEKCGASEIVDVVSNHQYALVKHKKGWKTIEGSDNKKIRETLQQEHKFSETILNSIPDGFDIVDENFRIIDMNNAFKSAFGSDAIGKKCYEVYKDDKKQCESCPLRGPINVGETKKIKVSGIAHGKTYQISHTGVMVNNKKHVLEVFEDVTEREITEKKIGHLASFPQYNPNLVMEVDSSGKIVYANPATENTMKDLGVVSAAAFLPADIGDMLKTLGSGKENRVYREVTVSNKIFAETVSVVSDLNVVRIYAYDVTARKTMEDTLTQQAAALSAAANGIVITDREGRVVWVNPALTKLTGYSPHELIGSNPRVFRSGKHDNKFYDSMWKTILSGSVWNGQISNKRKDGSLYYEEMTIAPVRDARGNISRFIAIKQDITERKQAEDMLEKSRGDLNHAQAVAKLGSWRLDTRKNELHWTDESYKLFGIPKGTPMTYELFLSAVHPDDRKYVDENWNAVLSDRSSGKPYDIEHRILVDGNVKWVREKAELEFGSDGSLLGGFGTVQDITERKQTEQALRETRDYLDNLFNYANAPIITWDNSYRITRFNRAFERLTGLTAEETIGKEVGILFPPGQKDHCMEHIMKTTAAGERWETIEIPILNKDGSVKIVLWNSANVYGADNKTIVATIAQGQDITDMKKSEEGVKKSLREKEVLLREIHHRVKNNLQLITSLIRLQASSFNNVDSAMLKDSQSRIRSIALVHEILYQTKDFTYITASNYLKTLANELGRLYNAKNVVINVRSEATPLNISTAIPCGLIVNELVVNSIKHAFPEKSGRIGISLRSSGSNIEITVEDNGRGLPEQFDLEKTKSMGLQVVRSLVDQLEGNIEISSENGTKVRVVFPKRETA